MNVIRKPIRHNPPAESHRHIFKSFLIKNAKIKNPTTARTTPSLNQLSVSGPNGDATRNLVGRSYAKGGTLGTKKRAAALRCCSKKGEVGMNENQVKDKLAKNMKTCSVNCASRGCNLGVSRCNLHMSNLLFRSLEIEYATIEKVRNTTIEKYVIV
jgi:hypothetical protein